MNRFKKYLLKRLTKHLFEALDPDEVLKIEGNEVILGGKKLSKKETAELIYEAQNLARNKIITKIFPKNVTYAVLSKLAQKGATEQDLLFARATVLIWQSLGDLISKLANLEIPQDVDK